jgi:hypothetical protein
MKFDLAIFKKTNLDALFLVNLEIVWDEFVTPWKVKFSDGVLSLGLDIIMRSTKRSFSLEHYLGDKIVIKSLHTVFCAIPRLCFPMNIGV